MQKYQNSHQRTTNHSLNYQSVHNYNTGLVFSSAIRTLTSKRPPVSHRAAQLPKQQEFQFESKTVIILIAANAKQQGLSPSVLRCTLIWRQIFFQQHHQIESILKNLKPLQNTVLEKNNSHGSVSDISRPLQFSLSNSSKLHRFADVNWAQGIPRSINKMGREGGRKRDFSIIFYWLSIKAVTSSRFSLCCWHIYLWIRYPGMLVNRKCSIRYAFLKWSLPSTHIGTKGWLQTKLYDCGRFKVIQEMKSAI